MKNNRVLSMILAVSIIVSLSVAVLSQAHWDVKKVYKVTEACWLLGYSGESWTFCQYNKFTQFTFEETKAHHVALRNERTGQIKIVHKKGHAKHKQKTRGPYRKYRVRTVTSNCDDC